MFSRVKAPSMLSYTLKVTSMKRSRRAIIRNPIGSYLNKHKCILKGRYKHHYSSLSIFSDIFFLTFHHNSTNFAGNFKCMI